MHSVYALLLIIVLIPLLARFQRHADSWPLWVRVLTASGMIYMPVGALLGPVGLGLIGEASLGLLDPLLNLVITWVGLVMGLQLRLRELKRIPFQDWQASLLQFAATVALVSLGSWPLLLVLQAPDPLALALLLGCLAGSSSATVITLALSGAGLSRCQRARTAILYSNLDGMYALFLLGLVSVLLLPHEKLAADLPLLVTLLIPPLVSLALAWVFHYFLDRAVRDSQLVLLLIGLLTFAGGSGAVIKVSPLVMGLLMGFWLTNQSKRSNHLYEFMVVSEWPIMMALILMGGLLWQPVGWQVCWLFLLLLVLRTLAKALGWCWACRFRNLPVWSTQLGEAASKRLRLVLLPMGGVPLAIALSQQQLHRDASGDWLLAIASPAVLLTVLLSALLVRGLGKRGRS